MNTVLTRRSAIVCVAVILASGTGAARAGAQDGPLVAASETKVATLGRAAAAGELAPAPDDGFSCGVSSCGNLTYHGGQVQHTQKVYTIFWAGPSASFAASYITNNNQFVQDLGGSGLYNTATQYTDGIGPIANAVTFAGTYTDSSSAIPIDLITGTTNNYLLNEVEHVRSVMGWSWDQNSYFQIFMPNGIGSTAPYCGFHTYAQSSGNPA